MNPNDHTAFQKLWSLRWPRCFAPPRLRSVSFAALEEAITCAQGCCGDEQGLGLLQNPASNSPACAGYLGEDPFSFPAGDMVLPHLKGGVQWTPVDCTRLCLLACCYYITLFLCVTPAFELVFPVSPHYSAALHLSKTCPGPVCSAPALGHGCGEQRQRDAVTQWLVWLRRWFTGGAHPCFRATVPAKGTGWTAARGACSSHPAPSGTCISQHHIWYLQSREGRWLPSCSQQAPWWASPSSNLSKPTANTSTPLYIFSAADKGEGSC